MISLAQEEKLQVFVKVATYIAGELSDESRQEDTDPLYAHDAWKEMRSYLREKGLLNREFLSPQVAEILWEISPTLGQIANDHYIIRSQKG